jgi:hypothetical protein
MPTVGDLSRHLTTALTVLGLAIALAVAGPTSSAFALSRDAATADATWARSAALSSGAIAVYVDRRRVEPYLGNFAAWGLAAQAERVRDLASLRVAWAHLGWYAAAEDSSGFVTDYAVGPTGAMTSTGDVDATDASAGTFLLAADAGYQASRSVEGKTAARARLTALAKGLDGALRAIEATTDEDGLTWAKPAWRVKYLMDQGEVYAGLLAAYRLFTSLGDTGRASRAGAGAQAVADGVSGLWDARTGTYDWAVHEDGQQAHADLTVLYPDAMEQVWAIAFGLVPQKRATPLLSRIKALHPELDSPNSAMPGGEGAELVGYWPWAAAAWLVTGDRVEADRLLTAIDSAALSAGRPWPFTSASSGQVMVLAARLDG